MRSRMVFLIGAHLLKMEKPKKVNTCEFFDVISYDSAFAIRNVYSSPSDSESFFLMSGIAILEGYREMRQGTGSASSNYFDARYREMRQGTKNAPRHQKCAKVFILCKVSKNASRNYFDTRYQDMRQGTGLRQRS